MKRRQFLSFLALSPYFSELGASHHSPTGIVLDDGYLDHLLSPQHPESPARYQAVKNLVLAQSWYQNLVKLEPKTQQEVLPWLSQIHSEQHIKAIKHNDKVFGNALLATGGCLTAVDAVMQGKVRNAFCASRPPGHHALNTGKEEGFCYFNHIAIAARYAQKKYAVKKVLIIDWDYHHGNGTEWAFYSDPSVLFFSTHDQNAYPGTGSPQKKGRGEGEGLNINVHLDCGSGDSEILAAFDNNLTPAVMEFKPDLILISAGFDSREDDLLGCFSISDDGFYQLTRWVMSLAQELCESRIISILEGGYNIEGNASAVISHLDALRHL
jgi:acetoin utilization deacetylase AcuC-like enzyme